MPENLSIGLKNGGGIVTEVVDKVEFEVNEQCVKYRECKLYQPFIATNKLVFHIEYPRADLDPTDLNSTDLNSTINATVSLDAMETICAHKQTANFSTILKNIGLDDGMKACN